MTLSKSQLTKQKNLMYRSNLKKDNNNNKQEKFYSKVNQKAKEV